jgi:RNA polymerase sigma-70 factor (ECF subfamily)
MAVSEKGTLRLLRSEPDGKGSTGATGLTDQQLVAAVVGGDDRIASALCLRVTPQIDRTIRRLLGRFDADHEDISQLCLVEIINTIGRYRGDCALDRWVQSVTAHVVFKHLRRRKLERRIFTNLLADDVYAGPVNLDRAAITRAVLTRIAAHLDGVSPPRAWAFVLHDALGYDLTEVAEMTACSVAAAQSRLSRGRRELHERISDDPELCELLRLGKERE